MMVKRYGDLAALDAALPDMTAAGWTIRRTGADAGGPATFGVPDFRDAHVSSSAMRESWEAQNSLASFNQLRLLWAAVSEVIFPGRITVVCVRRG